MNRALLQLSAHIDHALPQLIFFVFLRCLLLRTASAYFARVASYTFPQMKRRVVRCVYNTNLVMLPLTMFLSILFVVWVGVELLNISRTALICTEKILSIRLIGMSASVAFLCLIFTSRISVSLASILTFKCLQQHNILSGMSAVVALCMWLSLRGVHVVILLVASIALVHFLVCRTSSSAAVVAFSATEISLAVFCNILRTAFSVAVPKK
jgi:hypothetical protein